MLALPPMLTIYISLSLNQLGLHAGENGLALGQGQPDRLWRHCIYRSAAGDHFVRLHAPVCLRQLQQNFTSFPRSTTTRNPYHPQV